MTYDIPVESAAVSQIKYDDHSHELAVKSQKTGGWFVYLSVPAPVFEEFRNAESKGRFWNKRIQGFYSRKEQ